MPWVLPSAPTAPRAPGRPAAAPSAVCVAPWDPPSAVEIAGRSIGRPSPAAHTAHLGPWPLRQLCPTWRVNPIYRRRSPEADVKRTLRLVAAVTQAVCTCPQERPLAKPELSAVALLSHPSGDLLLTFLLHLTHSHLISGSIFSRGNWASECLGFGAAPLPQRGRFNFRSSSNLVSPVPSLIITAPTWLSPEIGCDFSVSIPRSQRGSQVRGDVDVHLGWSFVAPSS